MTIDTREADHAKYGHHDNEHMSAWQAFLRIETTPFMFEHLNGKPEPKEWGPKYPNLTGLDKWRKLDRKRELTADETRAYGAAVGEAIRKIQRRELCGDTRTDPDMRCNVVNTMKGRDNTQAGEDARYAEWIARLTEIRLARMVEAQFASQYAIAAE